MTSGSFEPPRDRSPHVAAEVTPDVRERTARIAKRLREDELAVSDEVTDTLAREIPPLDSDPVLVDMLGASVQGNVSTIIHVLATDIPLAHLQPPTAAVEYARRLAQRDVPANSLVRAYYMGQNVVIRRCITETERLGLPAAEALEVTAHLSDILYSYIDWITLFVFAAYEEERRRWLGEKGTVSSSTVHALLLNPDAGARTFERDTGYRLDQLHLAMVMWADDSSGIDVHRLDRAARRLAAQCRATAPPIVTAIDRTTIWAWIPLGTRVPDIPFAALELPDGMRAAFGVPNPGSHGFRRSNQQAQSAYAVATVPASPSGRIIRFADRGISVASLLVRELDATREWVREVLGGLADNTVTAATLRETLSVYFTTSESHVRTAEQLTVHRNTVKYRVNKAMSEVAPGRDRLDLQLALAACEFLGPSVIEPE